MITSLAILAVSAARFAIRPAILPLWTEPALIQTRPKAVPQPEGKAQKPGAVPISGLPIPKPIRLQLPDFRQLKAHAMAGEGVVYQRVADVDSDIWLAPRLDQRFVQGEYLRTDHRGWLDLRLVQVGFGRMIARSKIAVQKVERRTSPALQLKLVSSTGGFLFRRASSLQTGWDYQILLEGHGVVTANRGTAWSVRHWLEVSFPNGKRVERRVARVLVAKGEVRAMHDRNRRVSIVKAGQFLEFEDQRLRRGPTRFLESDLLELTELVNLGLLKLPTYFLPMVDAREDRAISLPMDTLQSRAQNAVFTSGVDGRPVGRFLPGNLDFVRLEEPQTGLAIGGVRPSTVDEVFTLMHGQKKSPSEYLSSTQVIARLKVVETDFREAPLNAEQQARLGMKVSQRAKVRVEVELTDVLTERTVTREGRIEWSQLAKSESRGQTMAEKALNSPLFLNACQAAAVHALYESAIDSDLRWRTAFAPQSPDSGNFTIPYSIGVYPGQRFTVLRANRLDRPAEVEVTSIQRGRETSLVNVRVLNDPNRAKYVPLPGDLIEEQLDF